MKKTTTKNIDSVFDKLTGYLRAETKKIKQGQNSCYTFVSFQTLKDSKTALNYCKRNDIYIHGSKIRVAYAFPPRYDIDFYKDEVYNELRYRDKDTGDERDTPEPDPNEVSEEARLRYIKQEKIHVCLNVSLIKI